MNRRLQQFLDAENITQAQFAAMIHVAPASISHILAGRNRPGYDFMLNTMKAFPDLNIEWLLDGQGKMYKTARASAAASPQEEIPGSLFAEEFQDTRPAPGSPAGMGAGIEKKRTDGFTCANIQSSEGVHSPSEQLQQSVKQRKAIKIVIFFDDGTFQELR